ncbi:hypothetical protein [Actinocorallia sp. A-T 12471]|uniref:hypothetical protein n=1 Tax=Actinocorallia sp. A-T 12471 TaxID=3089813 RepID=UPI0029CE61EC|nr:hypothetical protein [Actinocorallia sp. A-T 12471]MDX6742989.1 hypothetical protein [Actinocorallia sp. A-T 12471]
MSGLAVEEDHTEQRGSHMAGDERDGSGGTGREEPGRETPPGEGTPPEESGAFGTVGGPGDGTQPEDSGAYGTLPPDRRGRREPLGTARVDSGATGTERSRSGKDFNPAWLLVPAAGLMLGGLGIANMSREPVVRTTPTVTVTAADQTVTVPAAPVATTGTTACRLVFTGTTFAPPVGAIRDSRTGASMTAPQGQAYAVVNTTIKNDGGRPCSATAGYQRGYTGPNDAHPGRRKIGQMLDGGRALETAIGPGQTVQGSYVFQIPARTTLREVRLRQNGGTDWTTVKAR